MSSPLPISAFPPPPSGRSLPWREVVPVIVAESLERVESPVETMLRGLQSGAPVEIIGRIAQALSRPRDPRHFPDWLRPEQRGTCSRLLPILQRYNCALLADPVGTGKTYVALAVAAQWKKTDTVIVLAPAAIVSQWEKTASRIGVPINIWSHERLSRGSLPPGLAKNSTHSLVIIDESHHFRNPAAHRYRHVAPALTGHAVLLLSATPVVNSATDLAAQLTLGARDDALLAFGIHSIRKHLATVGHASSALGELILTSGQSPAGRPERIQRKAIGLGENSDHELHCGMIERLTLSGNNAIAELIRGVMWRAMASSDLALLAVLRRYRSLLLHARDAAECGRTFSRSELKSLAGGADQLVMWDLFLQPGTEGDLVIGDLERLDRLIEVVLPKSRTADSKCRRLVSLVEDGRPTLVFTTARETVRYIRNHLPGAAWCTGSAAGIGATRMMRDDVLSWFRPGAPGFGGPTTLITTDVSAEGLDLQHAARIVHYDLPWTAVKIDQRNGRALRLGSKHESIEVIRLEVPAPIEERLGQLRAIARKRRLPANAGIAAHGSRAWHWREAIAARFGGGVGSARPQYCRVVSHTEGAVAGFSLFTVDDAGARRKISTVVGFIGPDGAWSEEPQMVARMMDLAVTSMPWGSPEPLDDHHLARVGEIIRRRLELLQMAQWSHQRSPVQARVIARLNQLAAHAVRSRKGALLASLERAMGFVRRGHTSGEEMWIEELLSLSDSELIGTIRQCPAADLTTPSIMSELLGVVVFRPASH